MLPRYLRLVLNHRWVRHVGKISYGIYLLHPIVHQILLFALYRLRIPLRREIASQDAIFILLELALVVAAASGSWRFFEQPILILKKRFEYWSGDNRVKPAAIGYDAAAAGRT